LLHNGTHLSISKYEIINVILARIGFFHTIPLCWFHQHVLGHHIETNVAFRDPDLDYFAGLNIFNFGVRVSKDHAWYPHYKWWRVILPILVPMSVDSITWFGALGVLLTGHWFWTHKSQKWRFPSTAAKIEFFLQLLFLTLIPFAMMWNLGIVKGFLFVTISRSLHSIPFYFLSQISHINTSSFTRHKKYNPRNEWAVHQILTTIDYGAPSRWYHFWSVETNTQTMHHLTPSVHSCHHGGMHKIIVEFCKDWGIPYMNVNGYYDALKMHLEHLASVNESK